MAVSGDSAVIGETKALVRGTAGTTYPIERLVFPDSPFWRQSGRCVLIPNVREILQPTIAHIFPIGTLASTWNQELVESVGKAIGNEVLEFLVPTYC